MRIKDLDNGADQIIVREGKGFKDRVTFLPEKLIPTYNRIWNGSGPSTVRFCTRGLEAYISTSRFQLVVGNPCTSVLIFYTSTALI